RPRAPLFPGRVAPSANADPFGGPSRYTAVITWGDGSTSGGTISDSGGGTFTVSGTHTYTSPGSIAFSVQISHNQGFTTTATAGGTATGSGRVILDGTGGNDSVVVMRTAGGALGDVTYSLNGAAPVTLHGLTSFTFNGGAGNDTLTVDLANGPLTAGPVTFAGGADVNTLDLDS